MIQDAIAKLFDRRDLSADEAEAAMNEIMSGAATQAQIGAYLGALRAKGETEEVPRVLRQLQVIRLGRLKLGSKVQRTVMTDIPKNLNDQLRKLGLAPLFASPPAPPSPRRRANDLRPRLLKKSLLADVRLAPSDRTVRCGGYNPET